MRKAAVWMLHVQYYVLCHAYAAGPWIHGLFFSAYDQYCMQDLKLKNYWQTLKEKKHNIKCKLIVSMTLKTKT